MPSSATLTAKALPALGSDNELPARGWQHTLLVPTPGNACTVTLPKRTRHVAPDSGSDLGIITGAGKAAVKKGLDSTNTPLGSRTFE